MCNFGNGSKTNCYMTKAKYKTAFTAYKVLYEKNRGAWLARLGSTQLWTWGCKF